MRSFNQPKFMAIITTDEGKEMARHTSDFLNKIEARGLRRMKELRVKNVCLHMTVFQWSKTKWLAVKSMTEVVLGESNI